MRKEDKIAALKGYKIHKNQMEMLNLLLENQWLRLISIINIFLS